MEKEKIKAVLNNVIVNKLESITYDIKYYINTNYGIASSLDDDDINYFKFMDDEEIDELLEIRNRTKQLVKKLKNNLIVSNFYENVCNLSCRFETFTV